MKVKETRYNFPKGEKQTLDEVKYREGKRAVSITINNRLLLSNSRSTVCA